jgi:hypothetical protein
VRAAIASSHDLISSFEMPFLAALAIIPDPPVNLPELITPAISDEPNPPLTAEESANFSNCTFVDDNRILAVHSTMRDALHQSLISAFLLFGFPGEDLRGACLQDKKWDPEISHTMMYLGFLINSRTMTVSWPLYKRKELYQELIAIVKLPKWKRHMTPKQVASVIGKLWSAIQISPWGVYLSFALAANLKRASKNALSSQRSFWSQGKVRIDQSAVRDILFLLETLLAPEEDPIWTRPIALLIPSILMCRRMMH